MRRTRQNEESGRAGLVGAAVVGRHASLAAALIVTVGANLVLAVLLDHGIATGLPAEGSFVAGVAVVASRSCSPQWRRSPSALVDHAGASGLAAAVSGSPFCSAYRRHARQRRCERPAACQRVAGVVVADGWGRQMRAFGGDNWWPLSLFAIASIFFVGAAGMLTTRATSAVACSPLAGDTPTSTDS